MARKPERRRAGNASSGRALLLAAPALLSPLIGPVAAGAAEPQLSASIERHWTSNALDSEIAVADWYTLLRGGMRHQVGDDDANAGIDAEFQLARHDRIAIEDDRSLAVPAHAFRRLSPVLELRGTLAYSAISKGDHLEIGPLVIGTRALKQVASAQVQMGLALGGATALVLDMSNAFETTGRTHFEQDLLDPVRLDPDVNKFRAAARLMRTLGPLAAGGSLSALFATVEKLGSPPVALSYTLYGAQGELELRTAAGIAFGMALGAENLRGAHGIYDEVRPAWHVKASMPLPRDFELRGAWFGRFETADSDDPLASWLDRAEVELGWKATERLAFSAGVYREVKQNLLMENEERGRGFYAQATYAFGKPLSAIFRVDVSKTFKTILDIRERTTDAFIGLRARI